MKRKLSIFALILAVLTCFLTVSAFAISEESGNSQMPFVDADEITPEFPDVQTEADLFEEFEEVFGEQGGKMMGMVIMLFISMFLFLPSLVVMIIFIVLNSNTKKKIREYERFFGPASQNTLRYYNQNSYNPNYYEQSVNPTNAPMGTAPTGNFYAPQNDVNNQQGGQF